jgi:hypothetical protein
MIAESVLIEKVRTLLNEAHSENGVSLITDDSLMLNNYIKGLLPEAVLFVQMNRRHGALNGRNLADCKLAVANDEKGIIVLPEDYVRLISLKLDTWNKPCYAAAEAGSAVERAQTNKYTRAGVSSPVCVETATADGAQLSLYPVNGESAPSVEYLIYEARYDGSKGLATNNGYLIEAVACQCAGLVCNVFGKYDAANAFMSLAATLCNNNKQ